MDMIFGLLIIGVAFCVLGIFIGLAIKESQRKTESKIVYHQYEVSSDYHRLWNLLMEGRKVILLDYNVYFDKHGIWNCNLAQFKTLSNGERIIWGFGTDVNDFKNCDEQDFINYCTWKKVKFLDQVDVYNID